MKQQQSIIERKIEPVEVATVAQSKIPYRDGLAITIKPSDASSRMRVSHDDRLNVGTLRSKHLCKLGLFTTVVRCGRLSRSGLETGKAGWDSELQAKEVAQTTNLVMQMYGKKKDGTFGEAAVFSDQNVALNTPYYVAAR